MTLRHSSVLLLAMCGIAAVRASCSASATQTLRTSWNDGVSNYYLYDITVTNSGSEAAAVNIGVQTPASAARIDVTQIWNMLQLADTDETGHTNVFAIFDKAPDNIPSSEHSFTIAPGQTYTGSGYVVNGSSTTITAYPACQDTSSSSAPPASSSTSGLPSSTTTGTVSSSSSSSSDEACKFSTSISGLTNAQEWSDANYKYTQFGVSITNTGSETLTTANIFVYFNAGNSGSFPGGIFGSVSQAWNMVQLQETEGAVGYAPGAVYAVNVFNLAPGQTFSGAGFIFQVPQANLANVADYDYPFGTGPFSSQC